MIATVQALLLTLCLHAEPGGGMELLPKGSFMIPPGSRTVDQRGHAMPVEELSGITWMGGSEWLAISDDGNRIVRMTIVIDPSDGRVDRWTIDGGAVLGGKVRDYEGIAYMGPRSNTVLVCEEDTPAVWRFSLDTFQTVEAARLPLPRIFFAPNCRPNRGFESLTLKPDGTEAWTANEEALASDGPVAALNQSTAVRLLRYRIHDDVFDPSLQVVYSVEPVHEKQKGTTKPQSGLCDLAQLDDGTLLSLERSCIWNPNPLYPRVRPREIPNFQNRIYALDTSGASNVSEVRLLADAKFTPVSKRLLWSATGTLDNTEGIAAGPRTTHGQTILVVCDNQGESSLGLLGTKVLAFELRRR